jgi:thiamine kinase-like enzyme
VDELLFRITYSGIHCRREKYADRSSQNRNSTLA